MTTLLEREFAKLLKSLLTSVLTYICLGVVVIATAELYSTKPDLRFCTGSDPACQVDLLRTFSSGDLRIIFKKSPREKHI